MGRNESGFRVLVNQAHGDPIHNTRVIPEQYPDLTDQIESNPNRKIIYPEISRNFIFANDLFCLISAETNVATQKVGTSSN